MLAALAVGAWRNRIAMVLPITAGLFPVHAFLLWVGRERAEQYRSGYQEAWFIPQPQTVGQYWGVAAGALALVVALGVLVFVRRTGLAADGIRPRRFRGIVGGIVVTLASLVVLIAAYQAADRYVSGLPDVFAAPRR